MAKKNLSVEEILAACRNADGDGASAPAPAAEAAADVVESTAAAAASAAPAKPASKNMSVEEMLAAARAVKSGGAKPAAAAATPAAAAPTKKPSKNMSVEEMLAAARGEKAGGQSSAGAAAGGGKAAAKKAAAAPAAKKVSPKSASAAPTGPRDTSSILAAAKKADRRGPMSKAEAKAKGGAEKKKAVAPPMPEKPAYAAVKPPAATSDEDRRGFMSVLFGSFLAIGFVSLGAVSSLWGLGLARYLFPNILTEPPSQFKIGFPTDFPPGTVTTKFKAQFGVWVVNAEYDGQQMITAIQSICTHLGCTPNWLEGEQKFKCPCHGSGFYKDGINFEGPAPRPLERFAIKIADDGQLEIDKSKKFQQEMGQWKDGTCFVPV